MRLIDADALLKKYCKDKHKGDCKNCDWLGDSWCRCEVFGVQIEEAPTVDAVRHGQWIAEEDSWTCSVCGTENCYAYSDSLRRFTDIYCPCCGAKMGGADNG